MKYFFSFVFFTIIFLTSCHRHTVTSNTSNATINSSSNTVKTGVYTKPIIIVDAHGNVVVSANELPPTANKSILNESNAHGYTPEQTKNLAYRYKYIPPKILYVPDALSRLSNRGIYYVYKTKFWYWKNQNGYYYLDETYYN